jgi:SNF2 family DNA or RNA helicase
MNIYIYIYCYIGVGSSSTGAANSAEAIVNTFRLGHITMSPVLIISYEMFRKHSARLNLTPKLDIILCDEGHRLKNATGTKTITALAECKAKKRIVLSGTPIQNDLDELYAVVSFVTPGMCI